MTDQQQQLDNRYLPTVAILTPGEMGTGIGIMLRHYGYTVATQLHGRSEYTVTRARDAQFHCYPSDEDIIAECTYVFSIVPPAEAISTARRIAEAAVSFASTAIAPEHPPAPLYFLDLNATSPATARAIAALFNGINIQLANNPAGRKIVFVDGAIIGGPPKLDPHNGEWFKPNIMLSGPLKLSLTAFNEHDDATTLVETEEDDGEVLERVLGVKWVGNEIGQASGVKMCFASLTKGLTALAIESFTTAASLGLLKPLQDQLAEKTPLISSFVNNAIVQMPPKAYRWVGEMEEIADTFHEEGGFDKTIYQGTAEVFRTINEDTELGRERTGLRTRGKTVEDVTTLLAEGMKHRRERLSRAATAVDPSASKTNPKLAEALSGLNIAEQDEGK
ncbi:hypothetical protein TWF569_004371 [Orbilia oligospora]|uniref:Phosphogluconate dehydrogenase NAD-binding putative C-terminal domain-containing protein n=1 Tax=Orbilia oligospora TaxID=2813651 RepID=A0A7C8NC00_ORBOL|nr:hypothetical protein TWF103_003086 [Orbilia oligospora]KAF3094961.1 hypothetical protein TWF102_007360 [Orbilia oligospora]KAF3097494.1 hypothetical protein TWF706_007351 [Orbilia oligospora]KAF3139455.1 hypothetical protein TWF594_006745 [Orbilia oligospora]KAF3150832.1 hypothetical protein TWF569_004371 [Orbilia oligospora]